MGNRRTATKEIGAAGLDNFNGYIKKDFLSELTGRQAYGNYNEMRLNSPIIGALLFAIEMSVQSLAFDFASDLGEEDPRLEFLNEALAATSHTWAEHVHEALTCLPFGFSLFTLNYKREGGRMLWRKIKFIGQDTIQQWILDEGGGLQGVQQYAYWWPDAIPVERLLLFRINAERNNPEGRSMLRPSYMPYYYAKHLVEIEGIAFERNGAGMPVVRMPEAADPTEGSQDRIAAETLVRNVRVDEQAGIVEPPGWEFRFESPGGAQILGALDGAIKRHEGRMLMGALAQFLLLGQDRVGALATFEGGVDFFTLSINALADMVAGVWTRYAIPRLLELNGMRADGIQMVHTPAEQTDLDALGNFLQRALPLITWRDEDEAWLRAMVRLPEIEPEEIAAERDDPQAGLDLSEDDEEGDEEGDEQMSAPMRAIRDYFAARGEAPDEAGRRRMTKRLQRQSASYLSEQQRRILRAVADGRGS